MSEKPINVYWGANENKHLSNLAPRPFLYEGSVFKSVEHAYQSWKSGKFDEEAYARGKHAAKAAGKRGTKTDGDWNIHLMKDLMLASFKANRDASAALLATGNAYITHDQDTGVWGFQFPRLLMMIRSILQADKDAAKSYRQPTRKC